MQQRNPERDPGRTEAGDAQQDKKALDDLFIQVKKYRACKDYKDLLEFAKKFRNYSPYNAMLIQVQMPWAKFVATPLVWLHKYKREIRPGSRPIVILQPMGPVMFVFDVSDTEPLPGAPELPHEAYDIFDIPKGNASKEYACTISNAVRDGVEVVSENIEPLMAGMIRNCDPGRNLKFLIRVQPSDKYIDIPKRYHLSLNASINETGQYATLVHELAHLYCGHLGSPNEKWWPSRFWLDITEREFEAESVTYLVCARKGIDSKSKAYLADYLELHEEIPDISLDLVLKAAGLIERMGRERLKKR